MPVRMAVRAEAGDTAGHDQGLQALLQKRDAVSRAMRNPAANHHELPPRCWVCGKQDAGGCREFLEFCEGVHAAAG